jgi:four helix bundle protein
MMKRGFVKHYQDLDVYRAAFRLSGEVFEITKVFPKEEAYSLTDQVRRSARSVGANIAEAWGKRRYPKHFPVSCLILTQKSWRLSTGL